MLKKNYIVCEFDRVSSVMRTLSFIMCKANERRSSKGIKHRSPSTPCDLTMAAGHCHHPGSLPLLSSNRRPFSASDVSQVALKLTFATRGASANYTSWILAGAAVGAAVGPADAHGPWQGSAVPVKSLKSSVK